MKILLKWMMTGGTSILGNSQFSSFSFFVFVLASFQERSCVSSVKSIHDDSLGWVNGLCDKMLLAKSFFKVVKPRTDKPSWNLSVLSQKITLSASWETRNIYLRLRVTLALLQFRNPKQQTRCKKQTYSQNIFPEHIPYRFPIDSPKIPGTSAHPHPHPHRSQARLPGICRAEPPEEGSALGFGPHLAESKQELRAEQKLGSEMAMSSSIYT